MIQAYNPRTGQPAGDPGLLFVPENPGLLSAIANAVSASAGGPMLSERIFAGYQELLAVLGDLPGNLVGSVHADPADLDLARRVVAALEQIAGRIVFNGWPTGVAVVAQHHGGPWPATTAPARTSVGSAAIRRWLVPVAYQNFPPELLPAPLIEEGRTQA